MSVSRLVMGRVLVVGSGLTGSVTAALLRESFPADKLHISVWDKARGAGGRMTTSRNPKDPSCTVDLGAQFISATPTDFEQHERFYNDLCSSEVLEPLTGTVEGIENLVHGMQHFVTPLGISSVVKHFLEKSGADTRFNHTIKDIALTGDQKWSVTTEHGTTEEFDCVVMTMPIPQLLAMKGITKSLIDSQKGVKANLQAVPYSSRYALGLFFNSATKLSYPWAAKYVKDDDVVRYIAIDHRKRNAEDKQAFPSICIHTSVDFGITYLESDADMVSGNIILPRLMEMMPDLPTEFDIKTHKWRYSQVIHPYKGSPGAVVLQTDPLLICGGDGFSRSGFNGCLDSALKISDIINKIVQKA